MKTLEGAAQQRADKFSKVTVEGTEITCFIEDLNLWAKKDFIAGAEWAIQNEAVGGNECISVNESERGVINMPPKQKANELVEKYNSISGALRFSKAYALIAVDEIIDALVGCHTVGEWGNYWYNVKNEIEKL